jgi:hypothetical protein
MKTTCSAEKTEKECSNKIWNAKRKMERELANNPDNYTVIGSLPDTLSLETKSKTTISSLKMEDSRLLTDDIELAEELNRFFSTSLQRRM